MKQFRLLKQTRQATEYSCGASALQSVLSYWGKDVDEEDLMKILGTNPEVGTYPADIARVARSLGFEAEVKDNLTLDDVETSTRKGIPVITLGQAWASKEASEASPAGDWADGHYIVVLAADRDYVYFEDPFVRMGKGFIPNFLRAQPAMSIREALSPQNARLKASRMSSRAPISEAFVPTILPASLLRYQPASL